MSRVIMGFEFENEDDYFMAKKEMQYINKINGNIKTTNPEHLLEIYNKIIDDKIFKTPVGIEYLRNIQLSLVKNKQIDKSKIKNIPVIVYDSDADIKENFNRAVVKNLNSKISNAKKKADKCKDLYIKMIIVNVALVLTITVMFVISHNSKKFDEDYYRESIENEYISWENSIKERESVIKEKENDYK